jgi:hypothetical protein
MALLTMFSRHSNDMLSKVAKFTLRIHVTNIFCHVPYMLINGRNMFFHVTNTLMYTTYMCKIVTCVVVHTSHCNVHFVGNLATYSKETIEKIFVMWIAHALIAGAKEGHEAPTSVVMGRMNVVGDAAEEVVTYVTQKNAVRYEEVLGANTVVY